MPKTTTNFLIDLKKPSHRALVVRAYHALLSEGLDIPEAKRKAVLRAVQNWKEGSDKP